MRNGIIVFLFFALPIVLGCTQDETIIISNNGSVVKQLEQWLADPADQRTPIEEQDFALDSLTAIQADSAIVLLLADKQASMLNDFEQQWNNRVLSYDGKVMPFYYQLFGDEPADGRSLFISMHGGGGAPASVNDQQWDNQKHLYDKTMNSLEGMYLAPRASTNTWNLWHQGHIDAFFDIIIQMAVIKENVNPNRVYIMGYSAGGDGVYQLAPRMADRWAAASMMAGHPNETSPIGLKNTPFTLHMGGDDDSYNRNGIARKWRILLDSLESDAPGTYIHQVQIHEGYGHWMQLQDAIALPWMQNYIRNPLPESIVWKQDDVHHKSFYWLGVPEDLIETRGEVRAEYNAQLNEINIISNYSSRLELFLNDNMLNLDEPITIKYQGEVIYQDLVSRTILSIQKSISAKGDSKLAFSNILTLVDNEHVVE